MNVSVVMSVFSKARFRQVLDCVESLKSQSLPPEEIILVLDPKEELVTFYKSKISDGVRIIISENTGLSNARNTGIKSAKSEIIAFIDDDAVAKIDWLEKIVETYDDSSIVGVGGLVKPIWEQKRPAWFPEELTWIVGCSYLGLPETKSTVRNPIGCNMSFRKTIFEEVGYFRSDIGRFGKNLLGSEEPELSTRILEKIPNSKIVYNPKAVVYHHVPKRRTKLSYLWKRSFYEGVSKALFISSKKKSNQVLSTERKYLKHMLGNTMPSRLRRFYEFRNSSQLIVLFISIFAVFLGFTIGKILRY